MADDSPLAPRLFSSGPSSPPTIYVVDDDPGVLKSLSRLLGSEGLTVAAFSSPREFLRRFDPGRPGCVLLDVAMPEMSGLEVQQALIARGHKPALVFLTGHGDTPMSTAAMKCGAVEFLCKPVNDAVLLDAVRTAVLKDRLNREMRD